MNRPILFLLAGLAFLAAPLQALAFSPKIPQADAGVQATFVRGCHRNAERHFDPRLGRSMTHSHRGRDCRPEPVRESRPRRQPRDCHRGVERHRGVNGYHRHVGRGCDIQRFDTRRHDRRGDRRHDRRNNDLCVNIGGVVICAQ